jgi:Stage II sporulation protein E (SpoIIE)
MAENGTDRISKSRVQFMRQELGDLSQLNAAMFRQIFSDEPVERELFDARYDKTNPEKDGCFVDQGWDLRTEGDFHLVKRIGNFVYIIVGDTTGHHAYAGGLKVFVAAALQNIFDRLENGTRAPTSTKVLRELNDFFFRVGKAALIDKAGKPLQHGTNAVVIRVERAKKRATYASAGLPVFALNSDGMTAHGHEFRDSEGIGFPSKPQKAARFDPKEGSINLREIRFLAVFTDGFISLERKRRNGGSQQSFGKKRVQAALIKAVSGLKADQKKQPAAKRIASALVKAARKFRNGYRIPETSDDDRLVVIVDLDSKLPLGRIKRDSQRGR